MKEDHHSYINPNSAVAKRKPGLKSLFRVRTLDLCDTSAALYQLSKQANWEQVVELVRYETCRNCVYNCGDLLSY